MDASYIISIVLLFVAVVLVLEGAYLMWAAKHGAEAKKVAARLRFLQNDLPDEAVSIQRKQPTRRWSWFDRHLLTKLPKGSDIIYYIETSGTGLGLFELLVYSGVLGLVGAMVPAFFGKPWSFSALGGLMATLPWFWLSSKRSARLKVFERQIPEALDLIGRALRAGHSFPTAVKMVADEMPDPIAREFRTLYDETNFGVPQSEALTRLADRVPVDDMRYFVIAIMIQRETGGNLAELLDNISAIVRARLKLFGHIRTLSAEGRMSAWVLGLLPFAVALLVNIVNPKFMAVLWTDPMGLKLVGGALLLMVLGVLWMRKIIQIRV